MDFIKSSARFYVLRSRDSNRAGPGRIEQERDDEKIEFEMEKVGMREHVCERVCDACVMYSAHSQRTRTRMHKHTSSQIPKTSAQCQTNLISNFFSSIFRRASLRSKRA